MYLTHHSYSTSAKNKLEEEFFNYLQSIDRILIEDYLIEDFKAEILRKYDEICQKHPRCKPIEKRFYCQNEKDIHLFGSNASFTFLKTKK